MTDSPDCWNISEVNSKWKWHGMCKENSEGNCGQAVNLEGIIHNE